MYFANLSIICTKYRSYVPDRLMKTPRSARAKAVATPENLSPERMLVACLYCLE